MMRQLSLRWSVALLVVGSVLVAQLVGLAILLAFPSPIAAPMAPRQVVEAFADASAARRAGLVRVAMREAPFPAEIGGVAGLIATTLANLAPGRAIRVRMVSAPTQAGSGERRRIIAMRAIALQPGADINFKSAASLSSVLTSVTFPSFEAAFATDDGGWTVVRAIAPFWSWPRRVAAAFAAGLMLMLPLAWLSARRLTRPLERLAEASETLGRNPRACELPVVGPIEVRSAASAFNCMQASIARHLDERTAMLAAIAHDLRTPLTSLRLRAESAPSRQRTRMVDDIARMEAMTNDLLAYTKGEAAAASGRIDLAELATACVRDAVERGGCATLSTSGTAVTIGNPVALRRALDNVLDNALDYGGSASVEVRGDDTTVSVIVSDEGPGIPDADLERVKEPFVRLEISRSRNTGGTGLGLAIAQRFLAASQARLLLANRSSGGLTATLLMPRVE